VGALSFVGPLRMFLQHNDLPMYKWLTVRSKLHALRPAPGLP
jgi:hypothetical protein